MLQDNKELIIILSAAIFIGVILEFFMEDILKIKQYRMNRKKALSIIGRDAIRYGDKGAKLAYKGIMKCYDEKYVTAAEYFEKALKLNLEDHNKAFCYDWLAHCHYKMGKPDGYKHIRFRAAEALATNDIALSQYADCLANDGDFKNAEFYYNQALKYNPNNTDAYRALGFMAETEGEYEKALKYFDTVLKINASDIDVIYEKAVCHAALEENETAQELMKQALASDIDNRYDYYKKKISDIRKINSGDLYEPQKESPLD